MTVLPRRYRATAKPSAVQRIAVGLAIAVALIGAGCSPATPSEPQAGAEPGGDWTLSRLGSVDTVIEGTVIQLDGSPKENPYIQVVHVKTLGDPMWQLDSRFTPGGERTPKAPTDDVITINVKEDRELVEGRDYVFFITASTAVDKSLVPGDWVSKFEYDVAADALVAGTGDEAIQQADRLVAGRGAGLLDSMIALTIEQAEGVSSYWQQDARSRQDAPDAAAFGPLSEMAIGEPDPSGLADIAAYVAMPWERRQMPTDDAELQLVGDAFKEMGVELVWWEVAFEYDDATLDQAAWVGIEFEGIGTIGPVYLDPTDRIIPIYGWGPAKTNARVVFWPAFDAEHRASAPADGVDTAALRIQGTDLLELADYNIDPKGALHIRAAGTTASHQDAVSNKELRTLIEELTSGPDGWSERLADR